jgi:hypothetical protein
MENKDCHSDQRSKKQGDFLVHVKPNWNTHTHTQDVKWSDVISFIEILPGNEWQWILLVAAQNGMS